MKIKNPTVQSSDLCTYLWSESSLTGQNVSTTWEAKACPTEWSSLLELCHRCPAHSNLWGIANSTNCSLRMLSLFLSWVRSISIDCSVLLSLPKISFSVLYRAGFKTIQLLPWMGLLESAGHGLCSARISLGQHKLWRPQLASVRWRWES